MDLAEAHFNNLSKEHPLQAIELQEAIDEMLQFFDEELLNYWLHFLLTKHSHHKHHNSSYPNPLLKN